MLMMKGCHNLLQNFRTSHDLIWCATVDLFDFGARARGFDRSVRHARAFSKYNTTKDDVYQPIFAGGAL